MVGRTHLLYIFLDNLKKKSFCNFDMAILIPPYPPPKYSFPMSYNTLYSKTHRPYRLRLEAEQQVQSEAAELRPGQMGL